MKADQLPKEVKSENIVFLGYELKLITLDNGMKIFEQEGFNKFEQDLLAGKISMTKEDVAELDQYLKER